MKIDSVDLFYLAMPTVTTAADGSQDALVVRVSAGGHQGWGECEASPLPSIAAFVTPMSHGACRPVSASVLGETLDGPDDIRRMAAEIAYNSMDLLQAAHTWSGIEMAMWDLLGRARGVPAYQLLGYPGPTPSCPTPRCCSAPRRRRPISAPWKTARRASAPPSSAGRRSGPRSKAMSSISRRRARDWGRMGFC